MKRVVVLIALGIAACNSPKDKPVPSAAVSTAPVVATAGAVVLRTPSVARASFDMPAPKEHIKGEIKKARTELSFDPTDVTKTRGNVQFDLTELRTNTFDDQPKNDAQSEHARTWLEAVVKGAVNEHFRYATFTVKKVDSVEPSLITRPVVTRGDQRARVTAARVTGDFVVHGKTVEKAADVELRLLLDSAEKPIALAIETKSPFVVILAEHDVKPRDTFGVLAKSALGILGTKVADTASISVSMTLPFGN